VPREKFSVSERVEMRCDHIREEKRVNDWLAGTVVQADNRMLAVQFDTVVFSSNGWLIPDHILWCAHGSPNIRRPQSAE
jgi:hypothetical protein